MFFTFFIHMHAHSNAHTHLCMFVCVYTRGHTWNLSALLRNDHFDVHEFTNWILHYATNLNALSTTKLQISSAANICF